jgi:hypothetical protein
MNNLFSAYSQLTTITDPATRNLPGVAQLNRQRNAAFNNAVRTLGRAAVASGCTQVTLTPFMFNPGQIASTPANGGNSRSFGSNVQAQYNTFAAQLMRQFPTLNVVVNPTIASAPGTQGVIMTTR